jgi:hypothetical protein
MEETYAESDELDPEESDETEQLEAVENRFFP